MTVTPPEAPGAVPSRDVFICHSSVDADVAAKIANYLEPEFRCWIAPRDVQPGITYLDGIMAGLEQSRTALLLLSDHASESPHVQREIEITVSDRKPVLPVRLADITPTGSFRYLIGLPQWLDAHPGPIEDYLPRIADAVRGLVGRAHQSPTAGAVSASIAATVTPTPPPASSIPSPTPVPPSGGAAKVPKTVLIGGAIAAVVVLVLAAVVLSGSGGDDGETVDAVGDGSSEAESPDGGAGGDDDNDDSRDNDDSGDDDEASVGGEDAPTDATVLVARRTGGDRSIVAISVTDGSSEVLELGQDQPRAPSVSDTGVLAVIVEVEGEPWLAVGPLDGTLELVPLDGDPDDPAISPDGRFVAFTLNDGGSDDVVLFDLDAGEVERELVAERSDEGETAWSPDSTRVAVVRAGSKLLLVDTSGGVSELSASSDTVSSPAWSADGQTVAFVGDGVGGHDVWTIDIDGGEASTLATTDADELAVVWCAGGWVTITADEGIRWRSSDGASEHVITTATDDTDPTCAG